jgi:hypothetical protein
MLLSTIIVVLVIAIKAYFDNKNWGNVDHAKGLFYVSIVLIPVAVATISLYPLFLYGLFWNPTINLIRDLPLFYLGDSARTDRVLKKIFGKNAGEAFAFLMFLGVLTSVA